MTENYDAMIEQFYTDLVECGLIDESKVIGSAVRKVQEWIETDKPNKELIRERMQQNIEYIESDDCSDHDKVVRTIMNKVYLQHLNRMD